MKNYAKILRNTVKHWYFPLITGIILILVGVWTFKTPTESYVALTFVFSASFLVFGFLDVFFSISNRDTMDNWGWSLVLGLLSMLVGGLLIAHPAVSALTLPLYVGFLLMFRSFGAIALSLDLKSYGVEWGSVLVTGVLSLIFSFILIWNPSFAGLSLVIWTGLAFVFSGIFNIYLSFKLKKLHENGIPEELLGKLENVVDDINKALKQ